MSGGSDTVGATMAVSAKKVWAWACSWRW
jgi:hypothetical protein